MSEWNYRYQGLSVTSEICLPEWSAFEIGGRQESGLGGGHDQSRDADAVTIRRGDPGKDLDPKECEYRFVVKQTASIHVRDGSEIVFVPLAGSFEKGNPEASLAARRLRAFLTRSAWGVLMYQRRALILHASVVRMEEGAVAFCGRRGAGKSTLAAVLSTAGYPLLSDDLCRIDLSPGVPPQVYPSVPRFRLCSDALSRLGWTASPESRDHPLAGKYLYNPEFIDVPFPRPLRRIYLLRWGDPALHRLRGFNALTGLSSAGTWRGELLMAAGDPAAQVSHYTRLLDQVECWEFRRPRDLDLLVHGALSLKSHLTTEKTSLPATR